jgi:hypothetical protein
VGDRLRSALAHGSNPRELGGDPRVVLDAAVGAQRPSMVLQGGDARDAQAADLREMADLDTQAIERAAEGR